MKQYFSNNVTVEEGHALREARFPGAVAFCIIHFLICLFMLWFGVAWKLIFYMWDGAGISWKFRAYMATAVVGVMICLIFFRFTHSKFTFKILSALRLIPIIAIIFICYHFDDPVDFSEGNLACLVCLYIMDYKF